MFNFQNKKILILGAAVEECEIVKTAQELGIYCVVTDSNSNWKNSPAKFQADEAWDISWSDIDLLEDKIKESKIDGCFAGFSEKRVKMASVLCERLGFPFYAIDSDLDSIINKNNFKEKCILSGVDVPVQYFNEKEVEYPVIVKPADNGGSRGITVCYNNLELTGALDVARSSSDNNEIIIEDYLSGDEVMIYYVVSNGNIKLSAMCDRLMLSLDKNITQLPIGYNFPSKYLSTFKDKHNEKFIALIKSLDIKNGLIAFQSFFIEESCKPFDPTYRLDGTMTYNITSHENESNILKEMLGYSLGKEINNEFENSVFKNKYFQLPILLVSGVIKNIKGIEEVRNLKGVIYLNQRIYEKDVMSKKADFSQILCRVHLIYSDVEQLKTLISQIFSFLSVKSEDDKEMIVNTTSELYSRLS